MNRGHSIEDYLNLIEKLKKKKENIKFSSDFIIAYPGETNVDFDKTLTLLNKVKYINTYSFTFSARPGTPAANIKKIDDNIAKERLSIFQKEASSLKSAYRNELTGTTAKVLVENKVSDKNKYFGRDEYFNSVIITSNKDIRGKILNVKINNCNQNTLFGEIIINDKYEDYAA